MPARAKKFHENQYLGAVWHLEGAAQSPRLSSARANNSASLGSFPAESRVSRFSTADLAAASPGCRKIS
jgi:hypothetical protein